MKKVVIIVGSNKPKEKSKTAALTAEFIDAVKERYHDYFKKFGKFKSRYNEFLVFFIHERYYKEESAIL